MTTDRNGQANDDLLAARAVGLRYVNDDEPGISRRRSGKGFSYKGPDGATVTDDETLRRIRALAVPPAWTDVWIADALARAPGRRSIGERARPTCR